MKAKNFTSRNGNKVPNQFIIDCDDKIIFQSYNSIIAIKYKEGKTELDATFWDYSRTTGKYRNQFLCENKKETEKKIASGEYVLTNLNY